MTDPPRVELSDPHVVAAYTYCTDVVSGAIPACGLTVAACQRQLDDLERWATDPEYPYDFDERLAGKPCRFIEQLPHVKGPLAKAKALIKMEPWQCFIVTTLYGWIDKRTRLRRFRKSYVEVPRKNGKSLIAAGLCLYALAADGEQGAEVVSAATMRDQARIVFGIAQAMLRKRPDLATRLGLTVTAHAIVKHSTESKFWAMSREASNQDGLNISHGSVDELHAHKTRDTWDVIETAIGARSQPMLFVITTAGSDTSGICYEIRTYCTGILSGSYADDAQFCVIYSLDIGDEWADPKCWAKANPNFGVSVQPEIIASAVSKALRIASSQNNVKTKHFDLWCTAAEAWMNIVAWDACADPALKIEDFAGENVWIGFDLASKSDLACRARLFWRDLKPEVGRAERHYYLFVDNYLPEDTIESATNAAYSGWQKAGLIKTTPGAVLDFEFLKEDTLADRDAFHIVEAPFDPYQATMFAAELLAEDVAMVEYRNTVLTMSAPMKELEALVLDGRLHHDGNPCLRWQAGNVVCFRDAKDNVYPRKPKNRPELKIDAIVATIMALGRAMVAEDEPGRYEQGLGIRTLG